ncbi:MAG: hypothetical protein EOO63_17025 [Hymenobacter sp.]|nr:MAG: hypothetical protein EOO63_17025 [Hymenobacter sp.]
MLELRLFLHAQPIRYQVRPQLAEAKNGIERVIELQLNDEEKALLETSRGHVKEVMDALDKMGAPAEKSPLLTLI